MNGGRAYTEEEMRLCPHLRKQATADSPFKEKITINSESEATPAKLRPDTLPDLPAECPYSKTRAQNPPSTPVASANALPKDASDDEDEQPAGGCPVMNTNGKKRNPGFFVPEVVSSQVYVSPYASILESPNIFAPKRQSDSSRKWDAYPAFLKHSLLYMGVNYDKYRGLEVGYKFFVTDELREKGNVCFRKGDFAEALSNYEKAASIMRWLEFTPDEFVTQMKKLPKMNVDAAAFSEDMTVEDIDRIKQQHLESVRRGKAEEGKPPVKDDKYYDDRLTDLMLSSLSDANVRLETGQELREKADVDIHDNILFQLYSNMAACYLQMRCLAEARQAVAEMGRIKNDSSLFLIRQAQVLLADKLAPLEDLRTAQDALRRAIELKKTEKIYEHNPNFLKIFSLDNHETIFGEMLAAADRRMAEKKAAIRERVHKVLKRAKQVETAEANIIARGLVPEEGRERTLLLFGTDDRFEEKLLDKMAEKYRQAIFFFAASEKPEDKGQVEIAQRCLSQLKELREEVDMLWRMDLSGPDRTLAAIVEDVNAEFGAVLVGDKYVARLRRIQREQARELIEKYPFDMRLMEHVVQEIFKTEKKREKEEKQRKELEEAVGRNVEESTSAVKGSRTTFAMQILAMAVFLLVVAYFGKNLFLKRAV